MPTNDQTFASFVITEKNRHAHDVALAVSERPADVHNPLVIWGAPGTGKTHLLRAIANHTYSLNRWVRTHYTPTYAYRDEFLASIPDGQTEFRRRYHDLDMLLIDDIQDLACKEGLEEVFLFALDTLLADGKQVVMTCDVAPEGLAIQDKRLRRRIMSGLKVEIRT